MANGAQRAAAENLKLLDTKQAIAEVVLGMLEDFHRSTTSPDFKKAIERGYETFTGAPFFAPRADKKYVGVYLKGPPGHGKSTSFELGARKFAELTGLEVVSNPPTDFPLTKNHFVIVTQEMAGEISNMTMGGLYDRRKMTGSDGKDRDVMTKIPYERFEHARKAGAGLLLLDDVACAHESVQAGLLGMVQNKVYQGHDFQHFYIGLTGNLGAADGTFVQRGNAALSGRVRTFYVEDSVQNFSNRLLSRHNDEIGDAFVTAFLRAHEDAFDADESQLVNPESPRPQPRTWDALSADARRIMYIHQKVAESGRSSPYLDAHGGVVGAISAAASSHVGPQAASKYAAFMEGMLTQAYPMAKAVLEKGVAGLSDTEKTRLVEMVGRGTKNDGTTNQAAFQFQFAESAAAIAAQRMSAAYLSKGTDNKAAVSALHKEVRQFTEALYGLSEIPGVQMRAPYQAQGWYSLGSRLMARPELTETIGDRVTVQKPDVFEAIASGVAKWSVDNKKGNSVPITREMLEREIMRAVSGESPQFDVGGTARMSGGLTAG